VTLTSTDATRDQAAAPLLDKVDLVLSTIHLAKGME
jgi:hypothetical protein